MTEKKKTREPSAPNVLSSLAVSRKDAEKFILSQIKKGTQIPKDLPLETASVMEILTKHLLGLPVKQDTLEQARMDEDTLKQALEQARREYTKWDNYNTDLLKKVFDSPKIAEEYNEVFGVAIPKREPTLNEQLDNFRKDIQEKIHRLESIKERLPLYNESLSPPLRKKDEQKIIKGNKIFIVHGRNEATKETTARFLEKLELEPIILHEQANKGRTIIEKFEDHSSVGYAVALLTADDVGALALPKPKLSPRARQNVVFEWGYFIGKLGRRWVCALYEEGIERPSDLDGVVYILLDGAGAWKLLLAKELRAAGFDVDLNKVA